MVKWSEEYRKEYGRAWRAANRDKVKATRKAYYSANKDLIVSQAKDWASKNTPRLRKRMKAYWLKQYGITEADYEALLIKQDHKCACCKSSEPGGPWKRFAVDHDHVTGKIRGLLCFSCNTGIGNLGDCVEGVERALDYLKRANA